ncbi:MAG: site-specific DNA-methyltransferase [Clostridia bacterium]|nr:site-specific DNA-methyltransferase [Clostridia bacterium]
MDKLRMESTDMTGQNIEKVGKLFPNVITESKDKDGKLKKAINFDLLKQLLSDDVLEGDEAYEFTWVGKKASIIEANKPIRKTLRPCKEESKNWDTTGNLYIEGDNLDVLKLLQESYLGKIKMIYIDPPYNTGNDFVYRDDFTRDKDEYENESGVYDENGVRLFRNTETNGRFHSDWCSMIYPRLILARNLLKNNGAIFISVDDNEVENLKKICSEVFGTSNFIGQIAVVNNLKGRNDAKNIATCHEYLLIFGKGSFEANGLPLTDEQKSAFNKKDENGNDYQLRDLRKRGRPDRREDRPNMYFPIYYNEETKECSLEYHPKWVEIYPLRGDGSDGRWRWGRERVHNNLVILEPKFSQLTGKWSVEHRIYLNPALNPVLSPDECDDNDENEERLSKSKSFWIGGELSSDVARRTFRELMNNTAFDYPKAVAFVEKTLYMGSHSDSIILDFFSGSATTAHSVMKLNAEDGGNRKFIMVQLPEVCAKGTEAAKAGYKNICEIGKERIRRAGEKIKADAGILANDLDIGFRVLKLDGTNMKDVYYAAKDYSQAQLSDLISNIKEDRTDMDLLFACLLEWGLPLSLAHKTEKIDGFDVHTINGGDLMACFADKVSESVIREIAKRQPLRVVFRDSSFGTSPEKINVEEIFKLMSPKTTVKVI